MHLCLMDCFKFDLHISFIIFLKLKLNSNYQYKCIFLMNLKTKTKIFAANLISIKIIGPIVVQRPLGLKEVMKYLLGVNFINVLHAPFLYKSAWRSFSLVKFWLLNFWHQIFVQKMRMYNVYEIDGRKVKSNDNFYFNL